MFCKKGVLRNFPKFTGKHLCQSLFFNKVAGLRPSTLLKKRLWHRCFPVNFVKFLRTPFLTEHLWWLLQSCYCRCQWFINKANWKLNNANLCETTSANIYLIKFNEIIDELKMIHLLGNLKIWNVAKLKTPLSKLFAKKS